MKQTIKKKLIISVVVLSFVSLTIWYFFPLLTGKLFIYKSSSLQKKHLNIRPIYVKELPKPPATWESISIDTFVIKLPISTFNEIRGKDDQYITFASDRGVLSFGSLVPSEELLKILKEKDLKYPPVSFEEDLAVSKVLPADLSFFSSRDENRKISANLINKAILFNPDYYGELLVVNSDVLKAICLISEKIKNGYMASVDLYSPNGTVFITMTLYYYKDKTTLESDILGILGGLTMPSQPLQAEQVKKDISTIVNRYNKTEQMARPDGE
jgi:hypothetical protein